MELTDHPGDSGEAGAEAGARQMAQGAVLGAAHGDIGRGW